MRRWSVIGTVLGVLALVLVASGCGVTGALATKARQKSPPPIACWPASTQAPGGPILFSGGKNEAPVVGALQNTIEQDYSGTLSSRRRRVALGRLATAQTTAAELRTDHVLSRADHRQGVGRHHGHPGQPQPHAVDRPPRRGSRQPTVAQLSGGACGFSTTRRSCWPSYAAEGVSRRFRGRAERRPPRGPLLTLGAGLGGDRRLSQVGGLRSAAFRSRHDRGDARPNGPHIDAPCLTPGKHFWDM